MKELILVFLRLGITAFGGPAAHIAMMEAEFVRRLKWLTQSQFLDLLGAASLIPGPSSSEMAIYIGQRHAGWRGLILGGVCFISPAALIVGTIAWFYVKFSSLPALTGILYGIKPVIITIILQAVIGLLKTAVRTKFLAILGIIALVVAANRVSIPLLLLGAGFLSVLRLLLSRKGWSSISTVFISLSYVLLSSKQVLAVPSVVEKVPITLSRIGLFFLKIGALQFGSGYVLLAFLRADLVEHWHWLTEAQLLDAIAVGQFTPGPVFTTATFIGFLLKGVPGAIVATVAIFLPAFILVAISGSLIPRLRKSIVAGAFLDGVIVTSLALMVLVTWQLGRSSLVDFTTIAIAGVSLFGLLRFQSNSAWLILMGGAMGYAKASLFLH